MSSSSIEIEASDWLARLDGPGTDPELQASFERWRAADPRHEVACLRLEAAWGRLDRLQALRPAVSAIDPDLLTSAAVSLQGKPKVINALRYSSRRMLAIAAGVVLFLAMGWWLLISGTSPQQYATGVGGYQRFLLTDGSLVELNTNTRLRVLFTADRRQIELLQGESNFTVSHDANRPFVVTAASSAVRALGTQFNVRRRDREIDVIVTEGRVAVGPSSVVAAATPTALPLKVAQLLNAGQAAAVGDNGVYVRQLAEGAAARELAWQSGMLVFDGEPLARVIEEFNRYNRRQLVIADPQVASLKIGGYFKATNLDVFVSVLASSFGVRGRSEGERIVLESMTLAKAVDK